MIFGVRERKGTEEQNFQHVYCCVGSRRLGGLPNRLGDVLERHRCLRWAAADATYGTRRDISRIHPRKAQQHYQITDLGSARLTAVDLKQRRTDHL